MALRRRPQSFRGLVREYLTYIEHELERGIDRATVLQALGVETSSDRALRDAIYHARRRARVRRPPTSVAPPIAPLVGPTTVEAKPRLPRPVTYRSELHAPARPTAHPKDPAKPSWGSQIQSHRDFLELIRSTDDSEII